METLLAPRQLLAACRSKYFLFHKFVPCNLPIHPTWN